jgi:DNA-binding HxlR family transcriptional regulator
MTSPTCWHVSNADGLLARALGADRHQSAAVYQLTALARSLEPVVDVIASWSHDHWHGIETARETWDRDSDCPRTCLLSRLPR